MFAESASEKAAEQADFQVAQSRKKMKEKPSLLYSLHKIKNKRKLKP